MDIPAYLERIAYAGPLDGSPDTLRALHLAHLYTVPFENLDIHLGRPLSLDGTALFDKIVTRRRGGFCYELNGLFCALLRDLGFRVTMLSAEVARKAGGFSPPFDHLTLRVDLDEPWLVDIGFGDGFRWPVRLEDGADQPQEDAVYLIIRDGDYRVLMRRNPGDDWTPQYRFTLQPHVLADFAERCWFHQTSPESHFTQGRICTLATPEGRVTLSGMRLIETTLAGRAESHLSGEAEYAAALRERFGVVE
ncbi:MAG TPA: arylamine N-acetyltransferase [Bryobacteraceae bacterium]|nr:arylamine N-acetyltransferase [Bryobacteraceae bacterium]